MNVVQKLARRPEFDAITMGWGSDTVADLGARITLAAEYLDGSAPASQAEAKVFDAMIRRYEKLMDALA